MDLDNILYGLVELIERTNDLLGGHFSEAKTDIQEYATLAAKPIMDALAEYKAERIDEATFRARVMQTRSHADMHSLKGAGVNDNDINRFMDTYLRQVAGLLAGTVGG
jgi:ribosomal protein S17E